MRASDLDGVVGPAIGLVLAILVAYVVFSCSNSREERLQERESATHTHAKVVTQEPDIR